MNDIIYSKSESLNTLFPNFLDFTEKCVQMILASENLVMCIKICGEGKCIGIIYLEIGCDKLMVCYLTWQCRHTYINGFVTARM